MNEINFLRPPSFSFLTNRKAGGTASVDNNFDGFWLLLGELERVEDSSDGNDSCTMLIVVEHGDIKSFLKLSLDFEALRSLDVFQVYNAEHRRDSLDDID